MAAGIAPQYLYRFEGKGETPAYARQIIRKFATRAFRRPVTAQEELALTAVFENSFEAGVGFRDSVKDALQVVLTSPQFLFLIENSSTPESEPLDDYELASKLSYFLWNGPPDRATVETGRGRCRCASDWMPKSTRMIDDPRFARFASEFTSQWLASTSSRCSNRIAVASRNSLAKRAGNSGKSRCDSCST